MKKKVFTFLAVAILFIGCKKDTTCNIESTIEKLNRDGSCEGARVDKYLFNGEYVYLFDDACHLDGVQKVVDADCNVLGTIGGFAGESQVAGGDFSDAKFVETLWQYEN